MKLHNFIVIFGTGVIFVSFIFSVFFLKKEKPAYYAHILIFIVLGLLLSINTISNNNIAWILNRKLSIFIEQALLTFQSLMLGLFFLNILNASKFIFKAKYILATSLILQCCLSLIVLTKNTEIRPSIIPNTVLLIFCFFYFKDLIKNKPTLVLANSAAFWVVLGIFYSCCIGFSVNFLIPFISKDPHTIDLRLQIFSIANIANIILYLFLIKSYLCLKHPQNS
ncbi:MAG TPA: hypothetical protein DCQ97_04660 [Chitinophagaceae bacterium]|nr:hypothetical protein [Chitinophagaceae bacterium]